MVGCRRLPAAVASPAVMAVRRRRISVRTRVRFARFTSARSRDCAARFKTDFFFFLTLVACPWAIYCSFCVSLKLLTLNDAHAFVKRGAMDEDICRIVVHWLWSNSGSCPFSGRCFVTVLRAASHPTLALGCNRALHFCVFPLLVTGLARR